MSTKIIRTTPVFRLHARSGLSCCVGIGKPATTYRLIVDTGSSNTWVGANKIYNKTTSSNEIPNIVSVKYYGSGFFSGTTFTDEVTIAPGLVIPDQMIGVAKQSEGFQDVDSILGLGPQVLTHKTLQPDSDSMIPTVTDNLYNLGFLPENRITIFLNPLVTTSADAIGEIAWGGIDTSKFTGSITYVPVTTAGQHWGITQSVCYGSTPELIGTGTTIVDTGTAINHFDSDTFERYRLLTGAVYDNDAKLLRITPDQLKNLQTLIFFIGGTSFTLTPHAQIVSRSVTGDKIFLAVARIKSLAGYDYILGETFLKRFYSVFDTANKCVGFATTQYTTATTN